jgi:uncharacterized protein YdgA (DUF945 family)
MPAYQGTYYAKQLTFQDSDGNAVDISGQTFEMDIRDQADDTTALVTLTTENDGLVITDGAAGELEIRITAANTDLLPVGKMVFDILRTDSDPGPTWMVGGSFKVKQPITR